MDNYIQPGNILTFTASATVNPGQGVLMGTLFGVAVGEALTGQAFEAAVVGVYDLPKVTGAITAGQRVYWDTTARAVTITASTNKLIGAAILAAQSGAAIVRVRLDGVA